MDYHSNNINEPAYPKESACKDPDKPNNHPASEYAVDTLKKRVKKECKNKFNQPVKLINCSSSHKKLLFINDNIL